MKLLILLMFLLIISSCSSTKHVQVQPVKPIYQTKSDRYAACVDMFSLEGERKRKLRAFCNYHVSNI